MLLSPAFFNAGFKKMISSWKRGLATHGRDVGAQKRLTNVRYGDDLLVYVKSLPKLVYMINSLCEELALVGFQLNAAKTTIFTTCTENLPRSVDVNGGCQTAGVLSQKISSTYDLVGSGAKS
jgi:hypothetical protein